MGLFSKKVKIDYKFKNMLDNMLAQTRDMSPKLADQMKTDLRFFLLKQIAADGLVAKEEVQFINGYLDMNFTVDSAIDYLNTYIGFVKNYTLPETIKQLVYVYTEFGKDEPCKARDLYMDLALSQMGTFLLTAVLLCKGIIAIDGEITDEEIEGLDEIITASSDYINEKIGFIPEGVEKARSFFHQDYEG